MSYLLIESRLYGSWAFTLTYTLLYLISLPVKIAHAHFHFKSTATELTQLLIGSGKINTINNKLRDYFFCSNVLTTDLPNLCFGLVGPHHYTCVGNPKLIELAESNVRRSWAKFLASTFSRRR